MSSPQGFNSEWVRIAGLLCGPAVAVGMAFSPQPAELSQSGWWTAAIATWMAIWWLTEAIPLAVTALLPIVLFPASGLIPLDAVTALYANPLIFLFLGGFLIARALTVWQLDRRLARFSMRRIGSNQSHLIAAMMLVTAFLSMWVSNTATAMVMLPIGLSVGTLIGTSGHAGEDEFSVALLLGIAYAATIGGMGTIIGTPPNALFVAFMRENYAVDIGFLRWMQFGVPLVAVMLPICWWILTKVIFNVNYKVDKPGLKKLQAELASPGPVSLPEKMVVVIVLTCALGWIFRPVLNSIFPALNLTDAGIAMTGAILMFVVPVDLKNGQFLLNWNQAREIRWDVLILFGGGLTLASAITNTDLAQWIGNHFENWNLLPLILTLAMIGIVVVLVGELASNTAMAAVFLPVVAAAAENAGQDPLLLTLPIALFATLGFMLPVATPPNAIVFGSGRIRPQQMMKAGWILDAVGIALICFGMTAIKALFHL